MAVIPMGPKHARQITAKLSAETNNHAHEKPMRESGTEAPTAGISLEEFNALVLLYQDAAFNFAVYLTGDPDLAEDVTQKAFINAYLNIQQFHGASFRGWLFRIIRNVAYDEFRRPSYRKDTSLDALEDESGWSNLPVDSQDPQKAVEEMERARQIQRAIAHVAEPYRSMLILVDINEMDYQEAAQAAGVPVGTVKSRLARARQHFRAAMETTSAFG